MKINTHNLREDIRKIAIAFIIGSGLGYFTGQISDIQSLTTMLIGLIIWSIALIEQENINV